MGPSTGITSLLPTSPEVNGAEAQDASGTRPGILRKLHRVEDSLAAVALLSMASLPIAEVIVRLVYPSGIPGADIWVMYLTLCLAFLGATIAARRNELLSLNAGGSLLHGRLRSVASVFTTGVGVAVCAVLVHATFAVVAVQYRAGDTIALGVPVWTAAMVMPLGFAVVGARMLLRLPSVRQRIVAATFVMGPVILYSLEDPSTSGVLYPLLAVVIVAVALGAPIFVGLGGIAAVLLWYDFWPVAAIGAQIYTLVLEPFLPTIPLFTLAGYILAEGGTPKRLVELFRALFGWVPGGTAVVAVVVCAFFTSFTGGSGVTILAMGGLMYPMLRADRHADGFTIGLLTSAGSLGLLFPPSLAVFLYAVVAKTDVQRLFAAGLAPGVLEILLVVGFAVYFSKRSRVARVRFDARRALKAIWGAKWEVGIPFVVLGSIFFGYATIVQAAAITALYAFVLEFVIHRDLSIRRDLLRVVAAAVTLIGGVLLILGVARGLTEYLIMAQVPVLAVEWVQTFVESPLMFLLLLNVFLLAVGCLMDIYSAIVVVVPLIAPVGLYFGIDPFHLGIIFLTNLELGYLTPPVGMNLFLASYRFKRPLPVVYRATLPFLAIRAVGVLLVTYAPALTQWLPALLFDR